jgi:hypothetical protein
MLEFCLKHNSRITKETRMITPATRESSPGPNIVTITDETTGSKTQHSFTLEFLDERISTREFIRRRVYQEVQDFNTRSGEVYNGLVQPSDAEKTLNGSRLKTPRKLDWEAQYAKALEAFEKNAFIMLANDQQLETLEEEFDLREGCTVTFLKLVPLVGG